jgi:hypothetical protein
MKADVIPLIIGNLIFLSSLLSLKLGLSLAVVCSVLVGVVIASAVIPTFMTQRRFSPVHSEDIVENDSMNGKNGQAR